MYATEKLLFYTELRNNELVQNLGTEKEIRNLVETMISYIDQVNQVNYLFQRQKKKNIEEYLDNIHKILREKDPEADKKINAASQGLENFLDEKSKPIKLDFSDIRAIAYSAGTYKENLFDSLVEDYIQQYESLQQTGNLELGYFDEGIVPSIKIALDPKMQMTLRAKKLKEIFQKCCNYINRRGTLLQLADKRKLIHYHHLYELNFKEKLTQRQTKGIAGYFKKQAEIDGILFKMLHLTCLTLKGNSNPLEATEKLYAEITNAYGRDGFINVSYNSNKRK